MTREDFLAWAARQPSRRFERIDGIVVAMTPGRIAHNLRTGAASAAERPDACSRSAGAGRGAVAGQRNTRPGNQAARLRSIRQASA